MLNCYRIYEILLKVLWMYTSILYCKMGVHGLWKLIDSSGKPIPLEALENRILAVDVSIWLYQLVKGFQENSGHSAASAYLLGLFHRICKLLFYRIKPIFVFDGGVPVLKRRTIAARQSSRDKASLLADKLRQNLLENLAKQEALGKVLGENITIPKLFQSKEDTLYKLPPLPFNEEPIDADSDSEDERARFRYKDIHSIDITSEEFLALPADMRHDILTELKETRKENSWAKFHLMPEVGDEFSTFQMGRLLKRRAVQVGIEKAEGEMGTRGFTISDLQTILSDQGVELGQRIAADNTTKILYNSKIKAISKIKVEPKEDSVNEPIREIKKEEFTMEFDDNSFSDELSETECESKSLTQAEILKIIKQENQSSTRESKLELSSSPASLQLKNVKSEGVTELKLNGGAVENEPGNNDLQVEHGTLPQEGVHCPAPSTLPEPQTSTEPERPALEKRLKDSSDEENHIESDKSDFTIEVPDSHDLKKKQNVTCGNEKKKVNVFKEIVEENKSIQSVKESFEEFKNPPINKQSLNDTNILSSDDSDGDFIEVDETPIIECKNVADTQPDTKPNSDPQSKPLEIVVNAMKKLEDDLFSDVFESTPDKSNNSDSAKEKEHIKINNVPVPSTSSNSEVLEEEFEFLDHHIIPSEDVLDKEEVQPPVPQLSVKEIIKMKKDLERESSYLFKETSREDRIASTITEQIRIDAQELLQLFGIPYIIAPMEAEAQCAYLDITGQSHGTITDDSDIWLFGGNNVYKNFFDQKKFVQQFKSTDIAKCLNLGREEMIMLAILSGSDYTLGLTGVGSVTAFEIVAHYPKKTPYSSPVERLRHFAKEFNLKTLSNSIAKKLKKITITEGFPNPEIANAYLDPEVDKSTESFSWSKPNITEIRRYTRDIFGWDQKKTDKILEPVLENLNKTQTQGTLHRFFEWNFDGTEITKSRRVEKAINLMKLPSLLNAPGPSNPRPPIMGNKKYETENNDLPLRSKTPAQIAREKAAKKFQELKKQGKVKTKPKYK